jgi:transcriptional regulator with XRE-family HTH domain
MYLSLRKKVEAIAIDNDITFQELAELIGLDELTLLYYLEDGNELPVIYLAKMSQVLNYNFFSLFKFSSEKGNIGVTEPTENFVNVTFKYPASGTQELNNFMSNLEAAQSEVEINVENTF